MNMRFDEEHDPGTIEDVTFSSTGKQFLLDLREEIKEIVPGVTHEQVNKLTDMIFRERRQMLNYEGEG